MDNGGKMETKHLFILFAMSMSFLLLSSCNSDDDTGDQGDNPQESTFSTAIDETGGVLEVTDLQSNIYGAKVIIPSGALSEEQTISLRVNDTNFDLPESYQSAGEQIEFGPDGIVFETSIGISLPYSDTDNDGIIDGSSASEQDVSLIYFNEQTDEWEDVPVLNRNFEDNLVEAQTDHFSTYLVAVDETSTDDTEDSDATTYWEGEYFVGEPHFSIIDADEDINDPSNKELILIGCIGQDFTACASTRDCRECGNPYVLTITRIDGFTAVIDRFTTTTAGIPVAFNADGTSVSFDPTAIFEKVNNSGDAGLWEWRCDFIPEHTHITNFTVCETGSNDALCNDDTENRYAASITVISANEVKIDYGISLDEETGVDFTTGDRIAIRFEANYIGADE